jgi:hypothetical protein
MPQAFCPRCGARQTNARDGLPDFDEPTEADMQPPSVWAFVAVAVGIIVIVLGLAKAGGAL